MKIAQYLSDILLLIYPEYCVACSTNLVKGEKHICTNCRFQLPLTNYISDNNNKLAQTFWGRVTIEHTFAHYYFQKGNRIQKIIHHIKYKNGQQCAHDFGFELGQSIESQAVHGIDYIIPVPLTAKKLKKRGYNQSECIAQGISKAINKPLIVNVLIRAKAEGSQTKKSRFERWKGIKENFAVIDYSTLSGKHVLLVDDVITTGATIESCAIELLKIKDLTLSIAALAHAKN